MLRLNFIVILLVQIQSRFVSASSCEVVAPSLINGNISSTIGLIMIPGAKIPGASYLPLMASIQEHFPGNLWVAATEEWTNDMPNPLEISAEVTACITEAENQGLNTENIFFSGHSLGGIVLEAYFSAMAKDLAKGVVMLGTWLPDLIGKNSRADNKYPVPVLTAIGEIDGGGLSYLRREVEETSRLPSSSRALTKTILVPSVNHGQVASGQMNEDVIDNDIDAEVSEEEAHHLYGKRVADWLVINCLELGLLSEEDSLTSLANFVEYEAETSDFLIPFEQALRMEQYNEMSQFAADSQLDLLDVESGRVEVNNKIFSLAQFEVNPPYYKRNGDVVTITTTSHMVYDQDPLDFNNHLSARSLRTKMKMADEIYPELGLPVRGDVVSCGELNSKSLEYALSIASPAALNRMSEHGRNLTFASDKDLNVGFWGVTGGLVWEEIDSATVQLTSSRMISPPGSLLLGGDQYCDLLSPYRALEWIYIESIRHKMQFA